VSDKRRPLYRRIVAREATCSVHGDRPGSVEAATRLCTANVAIRVIAFAIPTKSAALFLIAMPVLAARTHMDGGKCSAQ
jgi:hypothetical protein